MRKLLDEETWDGLVFLMCLLMVLAGNSHLHYRPASALLGLTCGSLILLVGVSIRMRYDVADADHCQVAHQCPASHSFAQRST